MSRRRKHQGHVNHERWLVSYADFVTLLFAFFVVLYASSQVDKAKISRVAAAIQGAFHELGVFSGSRPGPDTESGHQVDSQSKLAAAEAILNQNPSDIASALGTSRPGFTPAALDQLRRELFKALGAEIAKREVILRAGREGLVVSLSEVGFYDSGSALMRPGAEPALGRLAHLLATSQYRIRIEGHTDNVPIHTPQFKSNWELSTARATELVKRLISDYGLAPERLSAAGYAEFHPIATNAAAEGRGLNRRVDLVILAPAVNGPAPSVVPAAK